MNVTQVKNNALYPKQISDSLKIGQEIITEFKKEFPDIRSATQVELTLLNWNDSFSAYVSKESFKEYANSLREKIKIILPRRMRKNIFTNFSDYVGVLRKEIKKLNAANCGEMSDITLYEALKRGKDAKMVGFNIVNKRETETVRYPRGISDHVFVVMDMDKKAQVNKISSWGKNAVVVDTWAEIVDTASNAIKTFKKMFKFDSQKEKISFKIIDEEYPIKSK